MSGATWTQASGFSPVVFSSDQPRGAVPILAQLDCPEWIQKQTLLALWNSGGSELEAFQVQFEPSVESEESIHLLLGAC